MRDLLEIRDEIDAVDKQLVELYKKRMGLTERVAEYKISSGKKVFDKEREQCKLENVAGLVDDSFLKNGVLELFEQIMSMSRKRQYQLLTEHGIQAKTDFVEVEELPQKNVKIV